MAVWMDDERASSTLFRGLLEQICISIRPSKEERSCMERVKKGVQYGD